MTQEPTVLINGEEWHSFIIDYDVNGRKFSFYIYAKSFDHAEEMVTGIKLTARVEGQVAAFITEEEDVADMLSAVRTLN